ncbi:cmpk [Symbiodinium sp. KB8]|nr:cmpk [Symbiodinium sp. KB8]
MGPPASGKSTLGENLSKHFKGKHIDLGVTLREFSSRPPEAILVEALRQEMEEAVRTVAAKPAHFVFVNGFPRMMDGFRFWQNHSDVVKPSLVLVLEAPDDLLKERAEQRGREGDEKFEERLGFYRTSTEPVIAAFRKAGINRQIDATGSPQLVSGHINVDRIREAVGSKFVAAEIFKEVAMYGPWGSPILLEGFPRDLEELKTLSEDGLVTLDFNSGLVFSGNFVRSFQDAELGSVDAVVKLLQCCQPLQVSPIFSAIGLLKSWMDAARHMPWWDFSFFLSEAQPSYLAYMRQESAIAARHPAGDAGYMRPSVSPPMDAWLCWFTHQLHTDDYAGFCQRLAGVGLGVGPLPPATSATWKAREEKATAVEKPREADSQISMEADALVNVPTAFVLAFAAFEEAGLSPLSDPRAVVCLMDKPAAKEPDLMSRFVKLLHVFYRRFLIIMGEAGPKSLTGPAVEMDWIWHAHMTHPLYSEDCRRIFGHLLPHVPCKPGESERIRSSPKDAGRVAMSQLNELLRSQLRDLAQSQLQDALKWESKHTEADDAVALGCFIPGGDRTWLAEKLRSAGGRLGQAFLKSLRDPGAWTCPSPTQNGLGGDSMVLSVSVQLMSGDKVFDRVMSKTSTVAELAALLRQEGESEDLKFFVQGTEVAADVRLGDTQVARGSVVQLVRIKRPPPVVTRRTSSPDWNRIPCTCFTDFCEFHVLAASGQNTLKFMRDLREGDMVQTGSSVESEKYRQISRIWRCAAGLTETVEVEPGCKLTVGHPVRVNGSWCRPETCKAPSCSFEEHVYTLELEGHVDTVLVGSHGAAVVCAALGVYCGEAFGWNIFTRKTRPCRRWPDCDKCRVAVMPQLDFANVTSHMLVKRYKEY